MVVLQDIVAQIGWRTIFMKIKDSIFSIVRKLFLSKSPSPIHPHEIETISNIFIPWEMFPHVDPDIFGCTQGIYEYWCDHIYIPYWFQLSKKEQIEIKQKAPSQEWLNWIKRVTTHENMLATKDFHNRHDIPFDYRFYLKDFMIAYADQKIQDKISNQDSLFQ